jgi:hypothetical protein
MVQAPYEAELVAHLHRATQVSSLRALDQYRNSDLVLFLDLSSTKDTRWEKVYAPYFGLFHSVPQIRGMYQEGVLRLRWRTNFLALVAGFVGKFAGVRKAETLLLGPPAFAVQRSDLRLFRSRPGGESCSQTCRRHSADPSSPDLECSQGGLARINECASMQKYFKCIRCDMNWGTDQPAYVHNKQRQCSARAHRCTLPLPTTESKCERLARHLNSTHSVALCSCHRPSASISSHPVENFGSCLINSHEPDCEGSHADTTRLCACVKKVR